jgi:hypothetical protein
MKFNYLSYRIIQSLHFQRISSEDLISYFLSLDMYNTPFFDTDLREKREKILFRELIRWNDYISHVCGNIFLPYTISSFS